MADCVTQFPPGLGTELQEEELSSWSRKLGHRSKVSIIVQMLAMVNDWSLDYSFVVRQSVSREYIFVPMSSRRNVVDRDMDTDIDRVTDNHLVKRVRSVS